MLSKKQNAFNLNKVSLLKLTEELDNIDIKIKHVKKQQKLYKGQEGKSFSSVKKNLDTIEELFTHFDITSKQNKINPKAKYTSESLLPKKKFDFESALKINYEENSNQDSYIMSPRNIEEAEIKQTIPQFTLREFNEESQLTLPLLKSKNTQNAQNIVRDLSTESNSLDNLSNELDEKLDLKKGKGLKRQ